MPPHPPRGISRRSLLGAAGAALLAGPLLSACGSGTRGPGDLRVSFQQWGTEAVARFLETSTAAFTAARPGTSVEIIPLVAAENDFFTKNELMMASARTTPDVVFEDTFILRADIAAGYLRPLDDYIADWPLWDSSYVDVAQEAVRGEDGKVYAIPGPTDARAIWYHRGVLERAGVALPWNPRTWDDVLAAARAIRDRVPDVVPGMFFAGKAQGEKASMQGLQMLFNGTGSVLYDESTRRWTTGAAGMRSALGFLHTFYGEGLGPPLQAALDPNLTETLYNSWMPEGTVGFVVDGNWLPQYWDSWPSWHEELGLARMPTQHGQGTGFVTLSGGMAWSLPALAPNPDLAWDLLSTMMSTEHVTSWTLGETKLANRRDVMDSPEYVDYSPVSRFFTDLVPDADYRPALAPYPQISSAIQAATEAVMTGQADAAAAADGFDAALVDIVGEQETAPEVAT